MRLPQMNTCYSARHTLCWRERERASKREKGGFVLRFIDHRWIFRSILERKWVGMYTFSMMYPSPRTHDWFRWNPFKAQKLYFHSLSSVALDWLSWALSLLLLVGHWRGRDNLPVLKAWWTAPPNPQNTRKDKHGQAAQILEYFGRLKKSICAL